MKFLLSGSGTLLFILIAMSPAAAQQWDTPAFFAPGADDHLGAHAIRPLADDWATLGASGALRLGRFGFRAGIGGISWRRAVLLGVEVHGPFELQGLALDLAWRIGAGGGTASGITEIRVPVGISAGRQIRVIDHLSITPYVHPRLALDLLMTRRADDTVHEPLLRVPIDVGIDVLVWDRLRLRGAATLNDYEIVFGAGAAAHVF